MSKEIQPRILKGFRDFLPDAESERIRIQSILEKTFRRYGFLPIDTPVLEYTEILLGKGGGETEKQIYRFTDNGGRDVAMRFDLTVPFARFMAQHRNELYLPFKRYHMAKVFRGENTQRGRYREFTQCDFDIVGTDSASADFEILLVMAESFRSLGIADVRFHLSHRGIFNQFLSSLGASHASTEVLRCVDKLSKVGREQTESDLAELTSAESAKKILKYITAEPSNQQTLAKMRKLAGNGDEVPGAGRLEQVLSYAAELGIEEAFLLDPSITRGLDYYTGIVFETFLTALPDIGSVCSGGRYNDLASLYTKEKLPGVGSSIGLDRLLAALDELSDGNEKSATVDVLVLNLEEELVGHYHAISETARRHGLSCEVFPELRKLSSQFNFAEKKGIPLGIICGGEEKKAGTVNLKDLRSRTNYDNLTIEEALQQAAALLRR